MFSDKEKDNINKAVIGALSFAAGFIVGAALTAGGPVIAAIGGALAGGTVGGIGFELSGLGTFSEGFGFGAQIGAFAGVAGVAGGFLNASPIPSLLQRQAFSVGCHGALAAGTSLGGTGFLALGLLANPVGILGASIVATGVFVGAAAGFTTAAAFCEGFGTV